MLTDSQGNTVASYNYEAFGELLNSTGTTANSYLFTGEQFVANLGDYYLCQRYYSPSSGRFGRRDTWEGSARVPISLHKYLYAHGNPVSFTDPSGYVAMETGGRINNAIGRFFIFYDPFNREYDHYGAGGQRVSLKYIIQRATGNWDDIGISGYNSKYPDLVDFLTFQLWEIKPVNRYQNGLAELTEYLTLLNSVGEMPRPWTPGSIFIPPPVIVTEAAEIAFVFPSVNGVITYREVDRSSIVSAALGFQIGRMMYQYFASEISRRVVLAISLTKGYV